MLIIGVDCGLSGALALMRDGVVTEVMDMPTLVLSRGAKAKREVDAHLLADRLEAERPDHAFVEQLWGMMPLNDPEGRGQGAARAFAHGKGYGIIIGVLAALDIPITLVTAQRWKKSLGVPADKDGARARASQLMPAAARLWPLKKHDGRAESALIALYGYQSMAKEAA